MNWDALKLLKKAYHSQADSLADYWSSAELLQDYHQSLGQRIIWKWAAALGLLESTKDQLLKDGIRIKDFGCGTGAASLALSEIFDLSRAEAVCLSDRSSKAVAFASARLQEACPGLKLVRDMAPDQVDVLLVSHILTELSETQLAALIHQCRQAKTVIWVDAGTHRVSSRLVGVREALRQQFQTVAPCFHGEPCGMQAPSNETHWCHFFAEVPNFVHQSAFWREFSKELSVDLRTLPLSLLVMTRQPLSEGAAAQTQRVIGRPRIYKGFCRALVCDSQGVRERDIQKRDQRDQYKQLKKGGFAPHLSQQERPLS